MTIRKEKEILEGKNKGNIRKTYRSLYYYMRH